MICKPWERPSTGSVVVRLGPRPIGDECSDASSKHKTVWDGRDKNGVNGGE